MASVAQNITVLADGYDLSPFLKSININAEQDVLDATALNASGYRQFAAGLAAFKINGEGFFGYDGTTDLFGPDRGFHDELSASANRLISIGLEGSGIGATAKLFNTKQATYNIQETIGDLIMTTFDASATLDGSTKAYARDGVWLLNQAVTGTVNGTTYDDGAGPTTGWLAHCHVTADDFTSMTVKVQHSTDGSSWLDLITFMEFSTVGSEQAVNIVSSVSRYVRAIVSAFSGTSATVAVAIKTDYGTDPGS